MQFERDWPILARKNFIAENIQNVQKRKFKSTLVTKFSGRVEKFKPTVEGALTEISRLPIIDSSLPKIDDGSKSTLYRYLDLAKNRDKKQEAKSLAMGIIEKRLQDMKVTSGQKSYFPTDGPLRTSYDAPPPSFYFPMLSGSLYRKKYAMKNQMKHNQDDNDSSQSLMNKSNKRKTAKDAYNVSVMSSYDTMARPSSSDGSVNVKAIQNMKNFTEKLAKRVKEAPTTSSDKKKKTVRFQVEQPSKSKLKTGRNALKLSPRKQPVEKKASPRKKKTFPQPKKDKEKSNQPTLEKYPDVIKIAKPKYPVYQNTVHVDPLVSILAENEAIEKEFAQKVLPSRYAEVMKLIPLASFDPIGNLNKPEPECPKDHVHLTLEERRETLNTLNKRYNVITKLLENIADETDMESEKRRVILENELNKVEEGLLVFSRKRVYVKSTDHDALNT